MTDTNGALAGAYDPEARQLRTVAAAAVTAPDRTDANGVWSAVYDASTGAIRVVIV